MHNMLKPIKMWGLALSFLILIACSGQTTGPVDIRYDREMCHTCSMIISDPAFAAQVRGGDDNKIHKFCDFGEAVLFIEDKGWGNNAKIWVMDMDDKKTWLEARNAHYRTGQITPMDFGLGAISLAEKDSIDYAGAVMHIRMRKEKLMNKSNKHDHEMPDGHQHQ